METSAAPEVTDRPADAPDAIEKGIFLTPFNKLVHACKVREDLGCGITRCGITFLIGHGCYRPSATFGAPPKEGSEEIFSRCRKCEGSRDYERVKPSWHRWKKIVRRTLGMIGRLKTTNQESNP